MWASPRRYRRLHRPRRPPLLSPILLHTLPHPRPRGPHLPRRSPDRSPRPRLRHVPMSELAAMCGMTSSARKRLRSAACTGAYIETRWMSCPAILVTTIASRPSAVCSCLARTRAHASLSVSFLLSFSMLSTGMMMAVPPLVPTGASRGIGELKTNILWNLSA